MSIKVSHPVVQEALKRGYRLQGDCARAFAVSRTAVHRWLKQSPHIRQFRAHGLVFIHWNDLLAQHQPSAAMLNLRPIDTPELAPREQVQSTAQPQPLNLRLRKARNRLKMTQTEAANRVGWDQSEISRLETQARPALSAARQVDALRVVEYFEKLASDQMDNNSVHVLETSSSGAAVSTTTTPTR